LWVAARWRSCVPERRLSSQSRNESVDPPDFAEQTQARNYEQQADYMLQPARYSEPVKRHYEAHRQRRGDYKDTKYCENLK
jgi:hypothetical protein